MQGLNSQNSTRDGEVIFACDQTCSSEIRTGTHALEDGRKRDETRPAVETSDIASNESEYGENVHVSVGEGVGASLVWCDTICLQSC
jgi:hypothetical protein